MMQYNELKQSIKEMMESVIKEYIKTVPIIIPVIIDINGVDKKRRLLYSVRWYAFFAFGAMTAHKRKSEDHDKIVFVKR